jgi:hypothetical protein
LAVSATAAGVDVFFAAAVGVCVAGADDASPNDGPLGSLKSAPAEASLAAGLGVAAAGLGVAAIAGREAGAGAGL